MGNGKESQSILQVSLVLPPQLYLPGARGGSCSGLGWRGARRGCSPLFPKGKPTTHLRQVPELGMQPAASASPLCSQPDTGILPPTRVDHQRMLKCQHVEDKALPSTRRAFRASSVVLAGRTATCLPPAAPLNSHPPPHFFPACVLAFQCCCKEEKQWLLHHQGTLPESATSPPPSLSPSSPGTGSLQGQAETPRT